MSRADIAADLVADAFSDPEENAKQSLDKLNELAERETDPDQLRRIQDAGRVVSKLVPV
jgi:hypothetical protein